MALAVDATIYVWSSWTGVPLGFQPIGWISNQGPSDISPLGQFDVHKIVSAIDNYSLRLDSLRFIGPLNPLNINVANDIATLNSAGDWQISIAISDNNNFVGDGVAFFNIYDVYMVVSYDNGTVKTLKPTSWKILEDNNFSGFGFVDHPLQMFDAEATTTPVTYGTFTRNSWDFLNFLNWLVLFNFVPISPVGGPCNINYAY